MIIAAAPAYCAALMLSPRNAAPIISVVIGSNADTIPAVDAPSRRTPIWNSGSANAVTSSEINAENAQPVTFMPENDIVCVAAPNTSVPALIIIIR